MRQTIASKTPRIEDIEPSRLGGCGGIYRKDKVLKVMNQQDRHHGKTAQCVHYLDTGSF